MSGFADSRQRQQVLDAERSFIVRAPAGSGKTELLMQRFLRLLAVVEQPEEILAITFTRKAAAEMRQRILGAIWPAADAGPQLDTTRELAAEVRRVNDARGWQLDEFPGRLRVRTIDSVNAWLTASAPATGDGTAQGRVSDRPGELYELAARRTLELLPEDEEPGPALRTLLAHLDNQTSRFVRLTADMLACRDQWLGFMSHDSQHPQLRAALEECLQELVERELGALQSLLPGALMDGLCELTHTAARNCHAATGVADAFGWDEAAGTPAADAADLRLWQGLAGRWLTAQGEWRKRLTVADGFPPKSPEKVAALELLEQLGATDGLRAQLLAVSTLPPPVYDEDQWEALSALLRVLPVAAAELLLVFREQRTTDYPQVAFEALDALGSDEEPTALALRLDYRIAHILVDEFQDTSASQDRLLRALTAGWTDDGRRTVFIVGDPMQSIYRFRQAEVALFLKLWREQRLGQLPLTTVELSANFRSDPAVVNWVNDCFSRMLPPASDPLSGRVRYSPSTAAVAATADAGVQWHPLLRPARVDEARAIGELVATTLQSRNSGDIGILVRSRNQARHIVKELRNRGIRFRGNGLDAPGQSGIEQDLLALARALAHFGDRAAWLALLRAPWCGLTLADLEALCGSEREATIWDLLREPQQLAALSPDGRERAARFAERMSSILQQRHQLMFRDRVEGAWQQLGGMTMIESSHDRERIERLLGSIGRLEQGAELIEPFLLHERLGERDEPQAEADCRVEIMTMHKAKGLQFDTVILPGLDGGTRGNSKRIMAWHELQRDDGSVAHLLAPAEAPGAASDPLHALVRRFEQEQEFAEQDRLLYVATTRAERRLHLFFGLDPAKGGGYRKPRSGSLLLRLWPLIAADYEDWEGHAGTPEKRDSWVQPKIRRFAPDWQPPAAPPPALMPEADIFEGRSISYDWAGSTAAKVGLVVHHLLEHLAAVGRRQWGTAADRDIAGLLLREADVPAAELDDALERTAAAVAATLADDTGRWILFGDHAESQSEFALTWFDGRSVRHYVLDRTFVTADGVRWIVDYKTSAHSGGDLEGFFTQQLERYAEQLEGYRAAMAALEPDREIRVALYFPLFAALREKVLR